MASLGRLDKIKKQQFDKVFTKALVTIGARNALALLELPSRERQNREITRYVDRF